MTKRTNLDHRLKQWNLEQRNNRSKRKKTESVFRMGAAFMQLFQLSVSRMTIVALLLLEPIGAVAQDFPTRAIRIVSGTQTGTSGDIVGRMLAPRLTAAFGQPVIFESRPGANGSLAANYVKGLPADGYNLFFVSSSTIVSGPFLVKNLEFDAFRDFSPITVAVRVPSFLLVHSSLPFDSVNGLIDYARANPGKLAYGSVGRGSAFHLIGESFKLATGVDMLHVPYSGANNANIVTDLLNNRIQVYFPAYPTVLSTVPSGKVKLLAAFETVRNPRRPNIPTVNETLPQNRIVPSWFGLMGPAGLPRNIALRLQQEIHKVLLDPEISAKLDELGITPVGNAPDEMSAEIKRGQEAVGNLVRSLGIEPN